MFNQNPMGGPPQMNQLQQGMGGLFGNGSPPQMTNIQGMGLGSPFFANRPTSVQPREDYFAHKLAPMSPQSMGLLGMDPNFRNMVSAPSWLAPEHQAAGSNLQMFGMENQMANPVQTATAVNQAQQMQQPVQPEQQPPPANSSYYHSSPWMRMMYNPNTPNFNWFQ